MNRLTLLFVFIFCTFFASAQEVQKVVLRVVYNGTWEVFESFKSKDKWGLDIGNTTATFYDWACRQIKHEMDGISDGTAEYNERLMELQKKYGGARDIEYAINLPSMGNYTANDHGGPHFFTYSDSIPSIQWELEDSAKLICEYECHKAVGLQNGRIWTAWYTTDIPLSYGPHIIGGLPGLILAASDSEGHFCFEAESIVLPDDGSVIELINTRKAQMSSHKQVSKIRKEYNELTNAEFMNRAFPDHQVTTVMRFDRDITHEKVDKNYYFDEE